MEKMTRDPQCNCCKTFYRKSTDMLSKVIILFFLFFCAIVTMLILMVFMHGGQLKQRPSIDIMRMRELDRKRPTPEVVTNWTKELYKPDFPCQNTPLHDIVSSGLSNIEPAVYPNNPFFQVDFTNKCSVSEYAPRKIVGVELSRNPDWFLIDVSLEPIQVVKIEESPIAATAHPIKTAKYWYLFPSPVRYLDCSLCRTVVALELKSNIGIYSYVQSIGTMANQFPFVIDITKREVIKREFKDNYQTSVLSVKPINGSEVSSTDFNFIAATAFYPLVGLSPLHKNLTVIRPGAAFDALVDLNSQHVPKLHYSFCTSNENGQFSPMVNCYPQVVLQSNESGSVQHAIAGCVCWSNTGYKEMFLFLAFLLFVFLLSVCVATKKFCFKVKPMEAVRTGDDRKKCTHVYNIFVRVALPSTRRIPGELCLRFMEHDETDVASVVITRKQKFSKTFIASNEVAELKILLHSQVELSMPKKARAVFSAADDQYDVLYFFGAAFTDKGMGKTAVFPYSHYLGDQRLARLSEASIWRRRIRRLEHVFSVCKLPTHEPPTSLAVLEHSYMILASFQSLPRSVLDSLNRQDSATFILISSGLFAVMNYLLHYFVYKWMIKKLLAERYYIVQSIPGLAEMLETVLCVFWIFALLIYVLSFFDLLRSGVWLTPMNYGQSSSFQKTVIELDIKWMILVTAATVLELTAVGLGFLLWHKFQTKPKVVLGPIAALEERTASLAAEQL